MLTIQDMITYNQCIDIASALPKIEGGGYIASCSIHLEYCFGDWAKLGHPHLKPPKESGRTYNCSYHVRRWDGITLKEYFGLSVDELFRFLSIFLLQNFYDPE